MTNKIILKVVPLLLATVVLGASWTAAITQPDQTAVGQDKVGALMKQTYRMTVPDYATVDPDEMNRMTDELVNQDQALKIDLFQQLQRGNLSNARKAELISLMGNLVVYQATDLLIKNIDFLDERQFPTLAAQSRGGYVAQRSLTALGRYSASAILDVIGSKSKNAPFEKSHVDGYTWVLDAVQGYSCAKVSLQRELDGTKDPVVRAQYRMVLNRLETFPHTN